MVKITQGQVRLSFLPSCVFLWVSRQHEEEESKLAELKSKRSREQGAQKPLEEQILEYRFVMLLFLRLSPYQVKAGCCTPSACFCWTFLPLKGFFPCCHQMLHKGNRWLCLYSTVRLCTGCDPTPSAPHLLCRPTYFHTQPG